MNPNPNQRTNTEEYAFEDTPIVSSAKTTATSQSGTSLSSFKSMSQHWFPDQWEVIDTPEDTRVRYRSSFLQHNQQHNRHDDRWRTRRSTKRRIFLFLTEPDTSIASAVFFLFLIATISLMNLVMIMQTVGNFQYTPVDCRICGGSVSYLFDDDFSILDPVEGVPCVCPPTPFYWTVVVLDRTVEFLTAEWILRVLFFEPPRNERAPTRWGFFCQWLSFVTSLSNIFDALATLPYYLESFESNGLMSLRLLRLLRVFQLVRLGQYSQSYMSLSTVLYQSVPYLKLLMVVLSFGAAFFGSIVFWLERGVWTYFEGTNSYEYVRNSHEVGVVEISPYTSIPASFWWFIVTVTTVGYGDFVPTSKAGKCVAAIAMLMGILIIAFPVSVFSDLWCKELHLRGFEAQDDDSGDGSDGGDGKNEEKNLGALPNATKGSNNVGHLSFESLPEDAATSPYLLDYRKAVPDGDHIVIRKDDLAEMVAHFQTITESQRQIRTILKKYQQPVHHYTS
jgi:hypothetical protein